MLNWIDTHCHLHALPPCDVAAVRQRAALAGVGHCVIPAVDVASFATARDLAHRFGDSYALGIHPLCTAHASDADLTQLEAALALHQHDPRLVAVGEIGLDFFVPAYQQSPLLEKQTYFYRAQLKLARQYGLPVILHVRRSADQLVKHLRALAPQNTGWRGIVHAFNGSPVQAQALIAQGLKLGFGGAMTFDAAKNLRALASHLPLQSLVLETDAPDMPPQWLYQTAAARLQGQVQAPNEPAQLPRIAGTMADLRGMPLLELARAIQVNALEALPRLRFLGVEAIYDVPT